MARMRSAPWGTRRCSVMNALEAGSPPPSPDTRQDVWPPGSTRSDGRRVITGYACGLQAASRMLGTARIIWTQQPASGTLNWQ
eukprot:1148073-Pelagomonas_calceolata.AAC.13